MTRVAFVCADPGVPVFGSKGCSIHVQQLICSLRKHGVDLELFVANARGAVPESLAGLTIHDLGIAKGGEPGAREQQLLAANQRLRELLCSRAHFDFVYERHALFSHAAMEYARAAGVPGLLEINAPLIEEQLRHRTLHDLTAAEDCVSRAFTAASHLLPVSQEVADACKARGAAADRIHVTSNGVDASAFAQRDGLRQRDRGQRFTVGFVGTLRPWHGIAELADGFELIARRRTEVQLLVVGGGPELEGLTRTLSQRGLSELCCFTGSVKHAEVPDLLASMDVGVAPYPRSDHFYFSPLKILEYMAAGLPSVASRIGQIPSLIRDGVDGLLHEPGDGAAMAQQLVRLAEDPAFASSLGRAAQTRARSTYSWDRVASRVLDLANTQRAERLAGAA